MESMRLHRQSDDSHVRRPISSWDNITVGNVSESNKTTQCFRFVLPIIPRLSAFGANIVDPCSAAGSLREPAAELYLVQPPAFPTGNASVWYLCVV